MVAEEAVGIFELGVVGVQEDRSEFGPTMGTRPCVDVGISGMGQGSEDTPDNAEMRGQISWPRAIWSGARQAVRSRHRRIARAVDHGVRIWVLDRFSRASQACAMPDERPLRSVS